MKWRVFQYFDIIINKSQVIVLTHFASWIGNIEIRENK